MGLQTHQKLIWLLTFKYLDCWSVHKSQKVLDWIKEKHPNILVVFVLANYLAFSDQMISFCSTHSSMHSRWSSKIGQLGSSNNRLKVAKIPMLISK
jgi:hypothetical protein